MKKNLKRSPAGRKPVADKKRPVVIYIRESVIARLGKAFIQVTAQQTIEERDAQELAKDLSK